jgi:predicted transcriptional regulator
MPKQRRPKTAREGFRFAADVSEILNTTAAVMHRTKTSIIEQLVREYCTKKTLNP